MNNLNGKKSKSCKSIGIGRNNVLVIDWNYVLVDQIGKTIDEVLVEHIHNWIGIRYSQQNLR